MQERASHLVQVGEGHQGAVGEVVDDVGVQDDGAVVSVVPELQQGGACALIVLDVVWQALWSDRVLAAGDVVHNKAACAGLLLDAKFEGA